MALVKKLGWILVLVGLVACGQSGSDKSATEVMKETGGDVMDGASNVVDDAKGMVKDAVEDAKAQGAAMVEDAKAQGAAAVDDAKAMGEEALEGAKEKGAELMKEAEKAAADGSEEIGAALNSLKK